MFQHVYSKKRRRTPDDSIEFRQPVSKLSRSATHIAASGSGGLGGGSVDSLTHSHVPHVFSDGRPPAVSDLWDPKLFAHCHAQQQQAASHSSYAPMVDSTSRQQHVSHLPIGRSSDLPTGSLGGSGGGRRSARRAAANGAQQQSRFGASSPPPPSTSLFSPRAPPRHNWEEEQRCRAASSSSTSSSRSRANSDVVVPIVINALDGKVISLRVPLARTVLQLKHMVYEHHTVPVSKQRLVLKGKELSDRQILSECLSVENANTPVMMQLVWRACR